jgi:putative pyruvate formate lyase activating enzyme
MTTTRRNFIKKVAFWGSALALKGTDTLAGRRSHGDRPAAYRQLQRRGELGERARQAAALFKSCSLCPRQCGVNRATGEKGFCRATERLKVYSAQPHFGEESSLVGRRGSGTLFFSNCNLRCVFCQNWPIAHEGHGTEIEDEALAAMMLRLQSIGCHNINLVTPTHVMPNILNAVNRAAERGLRIPLVYNTSGYERVEILSLLEGIVDIYLPDMKYMHPAKAAMYSPGASDYPEVVKRAVLEMHRQVGVHATDADGLARRGLMIRHLVMPNRVAGTEAFVRWVAEHLPKTTYVNIMAQYHVDYEAFNYPEIRRRITVPEYLEAMAWAQTYGLSNLDPDSIRMRNFYRRRSPHNGHPD